MVDVNSGRFVGKSNLEETITRINLEAVKETAYQMRLRNIGGIVIIDFIDMGEAANREKVHAALELALESDRAKTCIVRMSEIGLVEMTRKACAREFGRGSHGYLSLLQRSWIYQERTDGRQRSPTRYRFVSLIAEKNVQPFWSTCILPLLITCMKMSPKKSKALRRIITPALFRCRVRATIKSNLRL